MQVIVTSSFALLSAWAIWWTWQKRSEAERSAARARREAQVNRELADAGRAARDLAHDLGNLVAILHINLNHVDWSERERARETVRDVQHAALSMYRILDSWRGKQRDAPPGSSAVHLTTLCDLVGRTGIEIDTRVEEPLAFDGRDEDVVRVFENLLLSAGREAIRAGDPRVEVEMRADRLRIVSRIRDAERLEERIDEDDGSFSTGRGLELAREAAARVGWRIVHTVDDQRVALLVRPR
jgi:hypothetical protein